MSRKLAFVLAMLVLVAAMGLKTAVAAHSGSTLTASIGGAPPPPEPWQRIGGAPPPPEPWNAK